MNIYNSLTTRSTDTLTIENDVIQLSNTAHLFYCQHDRAQQQFQRFKGEVSLSQVAIDNFQRNVVSNANYCEHRGIGYTHIVFPAKIPVFHRYFQRAGIHVKPIYTNLHEHASVTYPISLLSPEKDFLIQDTHNSDTGKHKLIFHMLDWLGVEPPSLTPEWIPYRVLGDMGKRLNREERDELRFSCFKELSFEGKTFSTNSALKGNSGQIFFSHNPNAPLKKRLVLYGDSFILSCNAILRQLFEDVIYLRTPYIMEDITDNLEPDYVVTSNAERYLSAVPDSRQKKPYFMNYFSELFTPATFDKASLRALTALFHGRNSSQFKKWKRAFSLQEDW